MKVKRVAKPSTNATKVSKVVHRRIVQGAKAIEHLPDASADDIGSFLSVAQAFQKHMQQTYPAVTARVYVSTISRLFDIHRKAPEVMASKEYVEAVRGMRLPYNYSACAEAFYKFKSPDSANDERPAKRKAEANGVTNATKMRRTARKPLRALAHLEDASARDVESLPRILAGFKRHLAAAFPEVTAKQYHQVFRRLVEVHQKSLSAMGSKEYFDAVSGMGLRAAQVSAVKSFCKFWGVDVADGVDSQRHKANSEARKRLDMASQQGRPVSDADALAVLRQWAFVPNKSRTNVFPKGETSVLSETLGLITDRRGRTIISSSTVGSEDVMRLICRWLQDQVGKVPFPFTSISLNKGYAAARHRDKGNEGPSAARAIGDFQGGQLRYWQGAPADMDLAKLSDGDAALLDSRHGVVFFDGNCPHSVDEFAGERFSMVFFTTRGYKRATADTRRKLRSLGAQSSALALAASRRLIAESMAASGGG